MIISPGTSAATGKSCTLPSRSTLAVVATWLRKRFHRMACLEFLVEIHDDAHQHDGDDDDRADMVAEAIGDDAGDEQDIDQRIGKQAKKFEKECKARFMREAVRTITVETLLCFRSG